MRLFAFLLLYSLGLAIGCDSSEPATPPPPPPEFDPAGLWEAHAALPTRRQEILPAVLGDRIFLVGGISGVDFPSADVLASVDIYTPATDTWTTAAPLPFPRHHVAVASAGGTLYAFGGFTGVFPNQWEALDDVLAYDEATDAWTPRSPLPHPRGEHAAETFGGKIYVFGGRDPATGQVAALDIYDPSTDTWTSGPPLPEPRVHTATAVGDSLIYVVGGRVIGTGSTENVATVHAFSPASGQWHGLADLPSPRGGAAAGILGDHLVLVGGESLDPLLVYGSTYIYDRVANSWTLGTLAGMPVPVHGTGAVTYNEALYVLGGGDQAGVSSSTANQSFVLLE